MLVLLNPEAGGGRAVERWAAIEVQVRQRLGSFKLEIAAGPVVIRSCVRRALDRGERAFVAAGGDGTVNAVVSAILEHVPSPAEAGIRVGAIGLGSSNDFHKPFERYASISGIPVRLDFAAAAPRDACRIDYVDALNRFRRCEWLINSSVGTAAEANQRFNRPDRLLRRLKPTLPSAAMVYAAVVSILRYRPQLLSLRIGAEQIRVRARNLGIVKRPNFSGSLSFGSASPGEGRLGVHLIGDVGLIRLALVVLRLLRGRFEGPGTRSWTAAGLTLSAGRPFAIERDGEVVRTRSASFRVLPGAILLCA
jgi:diacylglycerol kinase family enzyme